MKAQIVNKTRLSIFITVITLIFLIPACSEPKPELSEAVLDGNNVEVNRLLKRVSDINVRDSSGFKPLIFAARDGSLEMIKELLKHGADIDARSNKGYTALMLSAFNGKIYVVSIPKIRQGGLPPHDADLRYW
mgnify:CR=1 FL=1